MPVPNKLPDGETLDYMNTVEGKTYEQIAKEYDAHPNSVYRKLLNYRRAPKEVHRVHLDTIPWRGVLAKHSALHTVRMLRALDDRNHGRQLPYTVEGYLDSWLKQMDKDNVVIDYDRENGWLRVPRLPEDGDGYIRMPPEDQRRG